MVRNSIKVSHMSGNGLTAHPQTAVCQGVYAHEAGMEHGDGAPKSGILTRDVMPSLAS